MPEEEFRRIQELLSKIDFTAPSPDAYAESISQNREAIQKLRLEAQSIEQLKVIDQVLQSMVKTAAANSRAHSEKSVQESQVAMRVEGIRVLLNQPMRDPEAPVGRKT